MPEPRTSPLPPPSAVQTGELSCRELVLQLLRRIETLDPQLRAWVAVDAAGALAQAEQRDAAAAAGNSGPLHGLTLGVKDIIDVAGLATLAGSPLRPASPAHHDAAVVSALRAAGAVILGKTVTTQWAFLDPPPTVNPWQADRTPGGSSSGSAAAAAARMCHVALGTQTGGSVIRPAAFCGLFGFMFARDVQNGRGILPLAPFLDRPGLLAGALADLRAVYNVLLADPQASLASDQAANSARPASLPAEVLVLREPLTNTASPQVLAVFERALTRLAARGGNSSGPRMVDGQLVHEFSGVAEALGRVMAFEAAGVHRQAFKQRASGYAPRIAELIRAGQKLGAATYEQAKDRLESWRTTVIERTANAVLVMPSAPTTAPGRETTGNPQFNSPWTAAGVPVLTVPIGLAADGLPVGLQLITAPGNEPQLFALAEAISGEPLIPPLANAPA